METYGSCILKPPYLYKSINVKRKNGVFYIQEECMVSVSKVRLSGFSKLNKVVVQTLDYRFQNNFIINSVYIHSKLHVMNKTPF